MTRYKSRQKRTVLTAIRLRKVLNYDPATGIFRWRITRPGVRPGIPAGCRGRKGFHQIRIDRTLYQSGRLAWLYKTGKWPKLVLGCINGNRADIRWANLREMTPAQRRATARTTNKLGVKGVWKTESGRYVAQIKVAGKKNYLGSFGTIEKASTAYARAAKDTFGQFVIAR